jgi:hypothetical protein
MEKEKIKNQNKGKALEITAAVVEIKKPAAKIRFEDKIDEQIREVNIPNVYHPNYKLIDDTIEEIKKASRKVCTNDYAANNVYVILQFALKKVVLAEA